MDELEYTFSYTNTILAYVLWMMVIVCDNVVMFVVHLYTTILYI